MPSAFTGVRRRFLIGDDDAHAELLNTTGAITLNLSHVSREMRRYQGDATYRVVVQRDASLDLGAMAWVTEVTNLEGQLHSSADTDVPRTFLVEMTGAAPPPPGQATVSPHPSAYIVQGVAEGVDMAMPTDDLVTLSGQVVQSEGSVLAGPRLETRNNATGSSWANAATINLSAVNGLFPWFDLSQQLYYVSVITRITTSTITGNTRRVRIAVRYTPSGGTAKTRNVTAWQHDLADRSQPYTYLGIKVVPVFDPADLTSGNAVSSVSFDHRWGAGDGWSMFSGSFYLMQEIINA